MKTLRAALLAAVVPGLLASCGSPAPRSHPEARDTVPVPKPAPTARHGGGYYLDDGPGDNPPANLDDIADAQPRVEPLSRLANNPYSVLGQDFVPDKELKPYKKKGVASWYGRRFHGQKTSSGDIYDMYAMTAAHPTLPIPCYARVTNVANGKSVVVRVNDRGPFLSNRIIDLSYTAAYKLGYANNGSTLVEVETLIPGQTMLAKTRIPADGGDAKSGATTAAAALALRPADKSATTGDRPSATVLLASAAPLDPDVVKNDERNVGERAQVRAHGIPDSGVVKDDERDPIAELIASAEAAQAKPLVLPTVKDSGGTFLQLGAFSSKDGAESFRDHLAKQLDWVKEKMVVRPKGGMFRLHLGPYASAGDAQRIAEHIRQSLDIKPFVVAP